MFFALRKTIKRHKEEKNRRKEQQAAMHNGVQNANTANMYGNPQQQAQSAPQDISRNASQGGVQNADNTQNNQNNQ